MTNRIEATVRRTVISDAAVSELDFLTAAANFVSGRRTFFGSIKSWFSPSVTVVVPWHLKDAYPGDMSTLNGEPLWEYKLVDGAVYALAPKSRISNT